MSSLDTLSLLTQCHPLTHRLFWHNVSIDTMSSLYTMLFLDTLSLLTHVLSWHMSSLDTLSLLTQCPLLTQCLSVCIMFTIIICCISSPYSCHHHHHHHYYHAIVIIMQSLLLCNHYLWLTITKQTPHTSQHSQHGDITLQTHVWL